MRAIPNEGRVHANLLNFIVSEYMERDSWRPLIPFSIDSMIDRIYVWDLD